jgi:hypothetical protein
VQPRSGQPHPGQIRPVPVEYTIRAFLSAIPVDRNPHAEGC